MWSAKFRKYNGRVLLTIAWCVKNELWKKKRNENKYQKVYRTIEWNAESEATDAMAHKSRCIDWFISGIPSNLSGEINCRVRILFRLHADTDNTINKFNSGLQSPARTFDNSSLIADRAIRIIIIIIIQICRFQFVGHKNGIAIKCQWFHVYLSFLLFSAEIEAIEACKWLRAAGFPQYAQMYEGTFEKSGGSWQWVRDQRMKLRVRGEFYIRNPFDYD